MYLDNPKRLFKDLLEINTLYSYMIACKDDGEQDNLNNLISIVNHQLDAAKSGQSSMWEDEDCDYEKDYNQLKQIAYTIKKEKSAKYILTCLKCGEKFYYAKKPKYDIKDYKCCYCKGDMKVKEITHKKGGKRIGAGRPSKPDEQKTKKYTFRLYLWEVEKVRNYIKSLRNKKTDGTE